MPSGRRPPNSGSSPSRFDRQADARPVDRLLLVGRPGRYRAAAGDPRRTPDHGLDRRAAAASAAGRAGRPPRPTGPCPPPGPSAGRGRPPSAVPSGDPRCASRRGRHGAPASHQPGRTRRGRCRRRLPGRHESRPWCDPRRLRPGGVGRAVRLSRAPRRAVDAVREGSAGRPAPPSRVAGRRTHGGRPPSTGCAGAPSPRTSGSSTASGASSARASFAGRASSSTSTGSRATSSAFACCWRWPRARRS